MLMKPWPSGVFPFCLPPHPPKKLLGIPHFLVGTIEPWGDFPQPINSGHFPAFSLTSSPSAYQHPPYTQMGGGALEGKGRISWRPCTYPRNDPLPHISPNLGTNPLCPLFKVGDSMADSVTVEHTASKSRMGPSPQLGEEFSAGAAQHSSLLF